MLITLSAVGRTSCTPWIEVEEPRAGFELLAKSKVSVLAGNGKTVANRSQWLTDLHFAGVKFKVV